MQQILIQRYTFELAQPLPPNSGYALYAFLLSTAPPSFAKSIHDAQASPISQAVVGNRWYISLIGPPQCVETMRPAVERLDAAALHRGSIPLRLLDSESVTLEQLMSPTRNRRIELRLQTPTAFKSNGAYQLLPSQELLLQSLTRHWNTCFEDICPIEDDGGGLEALAQGLVYSNVELSTESFIFKRQSIPGVTGSLTVVNKLDGFHKTLADALLRFAGYGGIGIKTALGMGKAGVALL